MDSLITVMAREIKGVKQGDTISIDMLGLTQVCEYLAEARRNDTIEYKENMLKEAHEQLSYVINDMGGHDA